MKRAATCELGASSAEAAAPDSHERAVGITARLTAGDRFHATLKTRFTDFIVREIQNGAPLQVTAADCEAVEAQASALMDMLMPTTVADTRPLPEQLREVVPEEAATVLLDEHTGKEGARVNVASLSKEHRGRVHHLIRAIHGEHTQSRTEIGDDGSTHIIVTPAAAAAGGAKGRAGRAAAARKRRWPSSMPSYSQFVLAKAAMDTGSALNELARALRVPAKLLSVAGNKDRRGVTTQLVRGKGVWPDALAAINGQVRNRRYRIAHLAFADSELRLGDLDGNEFEIVLRNVTMAGESEEAQAAAVAAVERWAAVGWQFINYFGLQRFGTQTGGTHEIGFLLLQRKYQEAAEMVLHVHNPDSMWEPVAAAFKRGASLDELLESLPKEAHGERTMLKTAYHAGSEPDWLRGFNALQRNMRTLYLHAAQSYLWNCAATARIQKYGTAVVPGDLIMPTYASRAVEEDIVVASEADVAAGKYSMDQVVLPVLGFAIKYPAHEVGQAFYCELMQQVGLLPASSTSAQLAEANAEKEALKAARALDITLLAGAYRHVIGTAKHASYQVVPALGADQDAPVSLPPLPVLQPRTDGAAASLADSAGAMAIAIKFQLPVSSYATMALREVLAISTSSTVQAAVTKRKRGEATAAVALAAGDDNSEPTDA